MGFHLRRISGFLLLAACSWEMVLAATTYEVGSALPYAAIGDVPWEALQAGDTVRIHWREEPYREKWVFCARGTHDQPVSIIGVPGPQGQLPVIEGSGATTRAELNFWGEDRAVIKIGGANTPANVFPEHLVIENLEVRGARPPAVYSGRAGQGRYRENAAAIWVEKGKHISIRGCILHDCGNGLMVSHESSDMVVESCHIHGNGTELGIYQHNVYSEAEGIVFQFNHLGPLRPRAFGNNLKDRSAGLVVRYNWIEGGNRLLDLVDSEYAHIRGRPDYQTTFVYGNVLVKLQDTTSNQICHYGGDSDHPERGRGGTLHLFNNTVISRRSYRTVLLKFEYGTETGMVRNNIFWCTIPSARIMPLLSVGRAYLANNWWPERSRVMFRFIRGEEGVFLEGENHFGVEPGFRDVTAGDFRLLPQSPCVDVGGDFAEGVAAAHPLVWEYVPHCRRRSRPSHGALELGAFGLDVPGQGAPPNSATTSSP